MAEVYLDIRNARVYRGDTRVFDGLTLAFAKGQNTCVLGPNGAGKSTLFKLLTRELYPVVQPASYVKIYGSETAVVTELRRKIGLVSQDLQSAYDAHVYGRDVVMSGLFGSVGVHGHLEVTEAHRQLTEQALERFGLTELAHRRYWHLSTGQQRKLLLARAMIHRPQVLILDEPTNGLDLKAAFELMAQLRTLSQTGTTLLLATHHLYEILPEIDRVVLLKNGSVCGDGDKRSVLTEANLSALYDTKLTLAERNGYWQAYPE